MTTLKPNKPLIRQTAMLERQDPLVVELHPRTLEIRVKGRHTGFVIPYDVIFDLGRKMEANRQLQARVMKRRRAS